MIKYMDKQGNVAEIIKYHDGADTVDFQIIGDDLIRTWYWDEFIKVFNTIVK